MMPTRASRDRRHRAFAQSGDEIVAGIVVNVTMHRRQYHLLFVATLRVEPGSPAL